ncbi:MAG: hypothetical protein GX202_05755 [Firmicutes bacterium]|nr:hypothetical protein [Bacillota bacterium]
MRKNRFLLLLFLALVVLSGCGKSGGGRTTNGGVSVTITPSEINVGLGQTYQFTATVTGTTNTTVTWSVSPEGGGSIDENGLYKAPDTAGTYTVTATSVADPTKSAKATVIVNETPRYRGLITVTHKGKGSDDLEIDGWIEFEVTLVADNWPTEENSYIIESVVANAKLYREKSDGLNVKTYKGLLENAEGTGMFWSQGAQGISLLLDPNGETYLLQILEIRIPCDIYYDDGSYEEVNEHISLLDRDHTTISGSLDNPSRLEGIYTEEPKDGFTLTIEWELDKIG